MHPPALRRILGRAAAAVLLAVLTGSTGVSRAADTPPDGFYRYPTIAGGTIVFASEGDLWKVTAAGGVAMRLTAYEGEEKWPALSSDGRLVAFTAQYEGNDDVYVVPNPYVGYNVIEPTNRLPGEARGERRLYFENLPAQCTIRIFTVNGDLVQTLERNSGADNGREFWNLLNRDGFSVAYGVYVAHIDAPGIGEKIVKFAIIK